MGLFASPEEKAAKQEEKLNKLMEKYGLEKLPEEYREKVKDINNELLGTGMMEAGLKLSMTGKVEDVLPVYYLKTIIQQNWIIIRLLNDIKNKWYNNSSHSLTDHLV